MKTDRELLELAAKAAGMAVRHFQNGLAGCWHERGPSDAVPWNPITDDGDALRLAVKLRLNVNFEEFDGVEYACAVPHKSHQGHDEVMDDDEMAATRLAIVRAAAQIGEGMA